MEITYIGNDYSLYIDGKEFVDKYVIKMVLDNHYEEDDEMEVDAAWDDVYAKFPETDYIEQF